MGLLTKANTSPNSCTWAGGFIDSKVIVFVPTRSTFKPNLSHLTLQNPAFKSYPGSCLYLCLLDARGSVLLSSCFPPRRAPNPRRRQEVRGEWRLHWPFGCLSTKFKDGTWRVAGRRSQSNFSILGFCATWWRDEDRLMFTPNFSWAAEEDPKDSIRQLW